MNEPGKLPRTYEMITLVTLPEHESKKAVGFLKRETTAFYLPFTDY